MTTQHYQGGMKHKYRVRQCAEPGPDHTQYQEAKVIYIAAEEVAWDYTPSRKWEKELQRLLGVKYGCNSSLYLERVFPFSHVAGALFIYVCYGRRGRYAFARGLCVGQSQLQIASKCLSA